MKGRILILGIILSVMAIGCSKNDAKEETTITADEVSVNAKVDAMNNDVSNIAEDQFNAENGNAGRSANSTDNFLPDCAVVTRVPAIGLPEVGGNIVKTIDFGTTGCVMPRGGVLKGKMIITMPYQPNATSHTATVTFENFYHNLRKVEGTKTFTRTMVPATANAIAHPKVVMTMNLTVTLPDNRVVTRNGTRTREITGGFGDSDITNNEYTVTGSWSTTFPNTTTQTSEITSPIIVKLACTPTNSALSKGIITFTRNNNTATLDYGDGTCDNVAVFTRNGVSTTITLGN
jgi:outer membrane murein-binding lipoprotein Lpp